MGICSTRYPQEPSTRKAGCTIASRHAAVPALLQFLLQFFGALGKRGKHVAAAVRGSASCHVGLMLAPIAHESVMKASTIPLDGTSVD